MQFNDPQMAYKYKLSEVRKFIFIAILTISIVSCKEKTKPESNVQNTNIESLTPGPIVHESLNKEQLDKIKYFPVI